MRAALRLWRSLYGGNPLHLLAMIGCFALVGYAVSFVYEGPTAVALLLWFGGAVLGHDLVLYPLYALADQPLTLSRRARRTVLPDRPPRVPAINHIRVPVLGSAVLGLLYFPTISSRGEDAFRFTAGLGTVGIAENWLLITGVLFLGSAVIYALRLGGSLRRTREPATVGAAESGTPERTTSGSTTSEPATSAASSEPATEGTGTTAEPPSARGAEPR